MTGWLIVFFEFFKTGLFAIGGGLATLPFLYQMADKYDWFTEQMVGNMIAISESTPGPMGINMATYTGFMFGGPLGAIVTTVGLVTPSIIVIILVSRMLQKFQDSPVVERVFAVLRPTVTGMIAAVGFGVIRDAVFKMDAGAFVGWKEAVLFVIVFLLARKVKWHPIVFIAMAAVAGIVFQF